MAGLDPADATLSKLLGLGASAACNVEHMHLRIFEPPADYVPWELDESLLFKDLPAGGRLAFAFRIILEKPVSARYVRVKCAGRKGWGMLLSEIQVFDTVKVDAKVPPLVVLLPLAMQTLKSP